jgi:hypothetical protein
MFTINLQTNIRDFSRSVSAFASKQVPFASAQALTAIARRVAEVEKQNEAKVLDRPRPFTQNALRVRAATKDRMTAVVWMMDLTAKYLEPYEFGGKNVLNGRALLKPVGAVANLDQYGNLPRNFMRNLRGRADIFIGGVQTKNGVVNGVWQRTLDAGARSVAVARVGRDGKVRMGKTGKGLNTSGHLKLLVKFEDAHVARQHLDWFGVARRVVEREFKREFGKALARAIATAK